jgi:hypothetical protein
MPIIRSIRALGHAIAPSVRFSRGEEARASPQVLTAGKARVSELVSGVYRDYARSQRFSQHHRLA